MSDTTALNALPREVIGKASKRLAEAGQIPAVLYGTGRETLSIALDRHSFEYMLAHHATGATLVALKVEGEKKPVDAVIKQIQRDPLKGVIQHVDFLAIRMDEKLQASAPFNFVGDSPGVKAGGVLMHSLREIAVEALPKDLPEAIDVDISELEIGDSITVADLLAPEGVEIIEDPEGVVCSVTLPTAEPTEEEEAAAAEGEITEPELIGEESSDDEAAEEE